MLLFKLYISESRKQIAANKDKSNDKIKPDYYECIQLSANIAFKDTTYISWIVLFIIYLSVSL
jgi:hypothetical protein